MIVYKVVRSSQKFHKKVPQRRDNYKIISLGFDSHYALNEPILVPTGSLKLCSTSTLKKKIKMTFCGGKIILVFQ